MCSVCGYKAAPGHWTEAGAASLGQRLEARNRRTKILRGVLAAYGVEVHDNGLMPGMRLSAAAGQEASVRDLDEVWSAARRLSGQLVDPLDPRLIDGPGAA